MVPIVCSRTFFAWQFEQPSYWFLDQIFLYFRGQRIPISKIFIINFFTQIICNSWIKGFSTLLGNNNLLLWIIFYKETFFFAFLDFAREKEYFSCISSTVISSGINTLSLLTSSGTTAVSCMTLFSFVIN